jgi:hypothetical protein
MKYESAEGAALLGKLSKKKKGKLKRGLKALLPIPGARIAAAVAARRAKKGKAPLGAKRVAGLFAAPPGIVPGAGIARIVRAAVARRKKQKADKKKVDIQRVAAGLQVTPKAPPINTPIELNPAPVSIPTVSVDYEPPSNEPEYLPVDEGGEGDEGGEDSGEGNEGGEDPGEGDEDGENPVEGDE